MVAMGYTQVEGVDYDETFASVMTTKSFRILLSIWNYDPSLCFEHWDVKTAFVNAPLKETVYCRQVPGFEKPGTEGKVLHLKKALYGTKQAANAWQKFLCQILLSVGGKRHPKDECVYIFKEGFGFLFLGTHVDDLFPLFNEEGKVIRDRIFNALKRNMELDNKGTISFALDTRIQRDAERGILKISQVAYTESTLKEYGMLEASGRDTPAPLTELSESDLPKTKEEKREVDSLPIRNLIGRLWWLALISRPDIQCALHKCAVWQNRPSLALWKRLMHILRYLKSTKIYGLVYVRPNQNFHENSNFLLYAMSDSSFASEANHKSRYGYFFFCLGGLVSWVSHHSTRIMSSSTEAECHALTHCGKENIWEREFLQVLNIFKTLSPTVVYQDNKSAITLSTGGTCHKRSKHFGLEFDLFREYVGLGEIFLEYRDTGSLPADMLTKSLPSSKFITFRDEIMGGKELQEFFL
jgi:hypothetical protein